MMVCGFTLTALKAIIITLPTRHGLNQPIFRPETVPALLSHPSVRAGT